MMEMQMEMSREPESDAMTVPLVAGQSGVYDKVEDAEGRLICFIGMSDRSAEIRDRIIRAINNHDALIEVARLASIVEVIGSPVNAEIREAALAALSAAQE